MDQKKSSPSAGALAETDQRPAATKRKIRRRGRAQPMDPERARFKKWIEDNDGSPWVGQLYWWDP